MTDLSGKPRGDIRWGIPASILVHVVFAVALFFHLPVDQSEPQKEETVQVEIVPPPEEPEKPKPEEKKAEEKKPEEAKPEETKPPEPAKQEEAKKAEPPPPPPEPPKQEEAKKAEPPPPPPPAPEEKPAEEAKKQPLPVLRPVFEFGEKDAGPKKSLTGNASKETTNPPAESKADAKSVEPVKQAKEAPAVVEAPPANPVPEDIQLPEVGIAAANGLQNGPIAGTSPDATKTEIVTGPPAASPKSAPSKTPTPGKPVELTEAKTLFSQSETGGPIAIIAMGSIPRGVRAGQLCSAELNAQLRHASYRPDYVPEPRLSQGTVLNVRDAGFRAAGQWYDLSFQCVINEDATKVVSFAFNVGAPVPRSEWRKRRFPEQ
ncbi:DUF930 domain-containing protein [Neorhizobium galegae]|uniref:DUF930 domain-containing protein n=1 Tax=Neorhizobium galegae bv. officinalis TaxID=323656 RepID=A0A0T7GI26_NEOGA|nr:DUF930 domain-containing protein [Neorhizobium galegae]CDZ46941.1 Hypothetical protein NGAL_HAMBI1189_16620 [Neorhizobium galegae bv. officinalis]